MVIVPFNPIEARIDAANRAGTLKISERPSAVGPGVHTSIEDDKGEIIAADDRADAERKVADVTSRLGLAPE